MGVGYTLAIIVMAFFREFLGTGGFTIGAVFPIVKEPLTLQIIPEKFAISMFQMPAGAFIVFGVILAVIAFINNRKAEKKAAIERAEKIRKAEEAKKAAAAAQAAKAAVEGGNK